jgi:integrase
MAAIYKLTPTMIERQIRSPGRYGDGAGIWLQVKPSGTKSWLYQYTAKGKERQLGLGPYPGTSLKQARKNAEAARALIADGIDPIDAKRAARQAAIVPEAEVVTFEQAAADYIETHTPSWKNEKHAEQWSNTLATYAMPVIGKLGVDKIETSHLLKILKPIWTKKPETAGRVRGRIESILDAAKAQGHRSGDNPATWSGHLDHLLPALNKIRTVRHHPAMPYTEVAAFVGKLAKRKGIAARALETLILTATRTGEVIGMRDEELDLDDKVWTIPGARMKGGKDHRVPLCDRAVKILRAVPREKNNPHLFIGMFEGTHLSNMAMLKLMKDAAPQYVPHGFRSTFTDWANDTTNASRSVIEMSLAHTIGDKVEAAYRRGSLFEKRRALMAEWEAFLYPKARQS